MIKKNKFWNKKCNKASSKVWQHFQTIFRLNFQTKSKPFLNQSKNKFKICKKKGITKFKDHNFSYYNKIRPPTKFCQTETE